MRPLLCLLVALTASAADRPAPVETDKRVQSDGKGWRIEKAVIKDAKLPRVLLIGDSILNGYQGKATKLLAGKANVDLWVNPYNQSTHVNKVLGEVLDNGPYDVVVFNMGLHGWQEGRIKPGTFEPLTKGYVEVLKAKLPKAKLFWASSTPVTAKGKPTELNPEINPNIIEQNRMAAKVMAEMGVPVVDFYGLLVEKRHLARGDMFHWTTPAYDLIALAAVEAILRELPTK
ncbi:MAG: SGNH/GDSL hydrolase family protein [Verrucomicrobia bacterium]|nr:SGNH/GDSL hydrolase family protein [Verrucomicrobiota bacterium]